MSYTSLYGAVVSRKDVEVAVINTLQPWIQAYLGEVERQEGLAAHTIPVPPAPGSFHGGIDFDTWMQGLEPVLIVDAQPFGQAERYEAGKYYQMYAIQVAAVCVQDEKFAEAAAVDIQEDSARHLADLYGAAVMMLLTQQGGFGPALNPSTADDLDNDETFAAKTFLFSAPVTEFIIPSVRRVARSITTVHSLIGPVVDEHQGPRTPPENPYTNPGDWPTANLVRFTLESEDILGNVSPSHGTVITDLIGTTGASVVVEE